MMFYDTVSAFFEAEGDFEENREPDALDQQRADALEIQREIDHEEHDAVRLAWEDEQYSEWARQHADEIEEFAYQSWAEMRRDDGEDDSREAYEDYIDAMLPDD